MSRQRFSESAPQLSFCILPCPTYAIRPDFHMKLCLLVSTDDSLARLLFPGLIVLSLFFPPTPLSFHSPIFSQVSFQTIPPLWLCCLFRYSAVSFGLLNIMICFSLLCFFLFLFLSPQFFSPLPVLTTQRLFSLPDFIFWPFAAFPSCSFPSLLKLVALSLGVCLPFHPLWIDFRYVFEPLLDLPIRIPR